MAQEMAREEVASKAGDWEVGGGGEFFIFEGGLGWFRCRWKATGTKKTLQNH